MKRDQEHISFLDHVRGIAILSVFLFHSVFVSFWYSNQPIQLLWNGQLRDLHASKSLLSVLPATLGWAGVAIFFVVSGFCIHLSHERSRLKGFKVFFLRRFFRIYPAYLLALFACAAVFPLVHHDLSNFTGQIISHLFLVYNFSETYHLGINASFWSIAVEVQLYALYPLLLWFASRVGWYRTLWITALIELGSRAAQVVFLISQPNLDPAFNFSWWYTQSPLSFWFSWSIGAALAEAYLKGQPLPFRNLPVLLWPALFLVAYFVRPLDPFTFTLASLATVYVIAHLLSRPTLAIPSKGLLGLGLSHLRWVGLVSYSTYLYHAPILSQVPKVVSIILHTQRLHPLLLFVCCLFTWPVALGISYLSYRFVELPSIAWGKKVIQNLYGTPSVTTPTAPVAAPVLTEGS